MYLPVEASAPAYQALAGYRHCTGRIEGQWPAFLARRAERLKHENESEMVAQAILEDLFTRVLDWSEGDFEYQVSRADIVLSRNLIKQLVIEAKRPGTLLPGRTAFDQALCQARRYADAQKVQRVAVSDGRFLYAGDVACGVVKDRVRVDLSQDSPQHSLWWLSVHGIYRPCEEALQWPASLHEVPAPVPEVGETVLLHPKYGLPAHCFAYVGDANKPHTWKLPYLCADLRMDDKRLPKAIQALLSNYRGAQVTGIPHAALPDVLLKLARAADAAGRLPPNAVHTAPVYQELATVLAQRGLVDQEKPTQRPSLPSE
jgi:hypothetical protein